MNPYTYCKYMKYCIDYGKVSYIRKQKKSEWFNNKNVLLFHSMLNRLSILNSQ